MFLNIVTVRRRPCVCREIRNSVSSVPRLVFTESSKIVIDPLFAIVVARFRVDGDERVNWTICYQNETAGCSPLGVPKTDRPFHVHDRKTFGEPNEIRSSNIVPNMRPTSTADHEFLRAVPHRPLFVLYTRRTVVIHADDGGYWRIGRDTSIPWYTHSAHVRRSSIINRLN